MKDKKIPESYSEKYEKKETEPTMDINAFVDNLFKMNEKQENNILKVASQTEKRSKSIANEYTVQRKIYDNYIKHKYDTNKIEELSEKYVYHDEHISVGYNLEYILDLYCICKEKQDFSDGYKHYYVIGEDTDLNKFYNVAKQKEYILDIDLDFLNSENDFVKYRDIIINLIKGTDIITIAREHSYFNFLRDNIEWTNDIALQKILNLLEVI